MTPETWQGILATTGTVVPIEARIGDREFVFQHRNDPHSGLVFCFGADITWQKQAERVLRQSEKMATLGTLAAGVAHELNNPAAATRRAAEQLTEAFARTGAGPLRAREGRLSGRRARPDRRSRRTGPRRGATAERPRRDGTCRP